MVGAPGREGRGAVFFVPGRSSGALRASGARRLATGFAPGDELGAAVGDTDAEGGFDHLWVGAPGRRGGQGEVTHRVLHDGRGSGPTTTFVAGTPAAPGTGSRLGAVLAASGREAIAGMPDADGPGGEPDAGVVLQLRLRVTGPGSGRRDRFGQRIAPPALGAADGVRLTLPTPAAGDRFGASVSDGDGPTAGAAVAGAPGLDVAGVPDAGGITTLRSTKGGRSVGPVLTQASPIVAGDPVASGAFGAAVATGFAFDEQSNVNLAVAAPGAGTVTFVERGQGLIDDAGKGPAAGRVVPAPGTLTGLGTAFPDYTEEDAETTLATSAVGAALRSAYPGTGFDARLAPLETGGGLGELVAPLAYGI